MAIAFDAGSNGGSASATTLTFSHTCTGSNRMLFVSTFVGGADTITGVTYNGVAMTQIRKIAIGIGYHYLYALQAPATGANNVVVSGSTSSFKVGVSASYTGVKQSVTLDNSAAAATASATSPWSQALTSVADNCWHLLAFFHGGGTTTPGQTERAVDAAGNEQIEDNNSAKTPAGSVTLSYTWAGLQDVAGIIASFEPAAVDVDINVNDTVTVAETIVMMVDDNPSVVDTVTVADVPQVDTSDEPSVFDTVTIAEVVTLELISGPSGDELITITEAITVHILELVPDVFEAVTITEAVTMESDMSINVSEAVAVPEAISAESPVDLPGVSEDVAVTESVTVMIDLNPSIFDAITVTESGAGAPSVNVAAARDGLIRMRSTEQSYPIMLDGDEVA